MPSFLVIALLLTLLFAPAAATSPVLDYSLASVPMESYCQDPDGLLVGICDLCGISLEICAHAVNNVPHQPASMFTPSTFLDHPEWPQDQLSLPTYPEPTLEEPLLLPPSYSETQTLCDLNLQAFNENATGILPDTIQIHIEGTYTPGDRLVAQGRPSPQIQRRQAPRPNGFPCTVEACGKTFDRSCDLNRHQKTHLDPSERPHKCSVCNEGFNYPKDRKRHQRTHDQPASPKDTLYCRFPGCSKTDGFSRRDNLLRHQRKKHLQG